MKRIKTYSELTECINEEIRNQMLLCSNLSDYRQRNWNVGIKAFPEKLPVCHRMPEPDCSFSRLLTVAGMEIAVMAADAFLTLF